MSTKRPSARANGDSDPPPLPLTASIPARELALLHAKARVCDAYMLWLVGTTRDNRRRVSVALAAVHLLEHEREQEAIG